MKQFLIIALFLLFLFMLFSMEAAAAFTEEQAKAAGVEDLSRALPESARREMSSIDVSDGVDLEESFGKLLESANSRLPNVFRTAISTAFSLFAIASLCGVCGSVLSAGSLGGGPTNYVNLAGAAAITLASVGNVRSMLGLCSTAISDVSVFSKVLMPAVATSAAMAGMPASGGAQCFATMLFSQIFITVINRVILPLVYAYIALIAANAALSNDLLKKSADFVKWLCTTALKLILTVFVAYIGISGAVAGSADAFAVKTLKFAVSGALPVVGSIVGDASESMIAGAGILKNSIGIYGMLAILAICLTPLILTGVHYLIYKAAAALSAPVCSKELGDLMDGIGGSFGLAFGMLGGCLLLFCISLIMAIAFLKPV